MLERLGINTRDSAAQDQERRRGDGDRHPAAVRPPGLAHRRRRQRARRRHSLQGGTLLVTPLLGADGEVYAVRQGPVAVGGFAAEGDAASVTGACRPAARISNGAHHRARDRLRARPAASGPAGAAQSRLHHRRRIARPSTAISAPARPRRSIRPPCELTVPAEFPATSSALLTDIEQLRVEPDQLARVVIDESSGIIVMGENVRDRHGRRRPGQPDRHASPKRRRSSSPTPSPTGADRRGARTQITVDDSPASAWRCSTAA